MMKILIEIAVIVLAVFLNSVELGTPLGSGFPLRPGSAPKATRVAAPSGRRQPGRGERPGTTQSGSSSQPAAAPETPPPTSEILTKRAVADIAYIEDPQLGFIKIRDAHSQGLHLKLFQHRHFILGRLVGDEILPIFNQDHKIIRIDLNQNYLAITMGKTVARNWGVFGSYTDFFRKNIASLRS